MLEIFFGGTILGRVYVGTLVFVIPSILSLLLVRTFSSGLSSRSSRVCRFLAIFLLWIGFVGIYLLVLGLLIVDWIGNILRSYL